MSSEVRRRSPRPARRCRARMPSAWLRWRPLSPSSSQRRFAPVRGCYVGNGADAEQITGGLDGVESIELKRHAHRQHIRHPHSSQVAVRRLFRSRGRQQRHRGGFGRNGVVIGHDHIHIQGMGSLQGFFRATPLSTVTSRRMPSACRRLTMAGFNPALIHSRWNRCCGASPGVGRPEQQSRTGHAIGVVIAADSQTPAS